MRRKFDFGENIGIITTRKWYSSIIKGHHEHASTYDFPVRIKFIENHLVGSREGELPEFSLPEYIECVKELEAEGVKAITLDCGLTGGMQEELANAVNIPVFTSNLLVVPLVLRTIGNNKKVGILTDCSEYLLKDNSKTLRSCGVQPESNQVIVRGMMESEYRDVWVTQYLGLEKEDLEKWRLKPLGEFNLQKVEEAIVLVAEKMVSENPDIGAIVLECTEMPLYVKAIREATGLPVFDSVSLVKYIHAATVSV